MDPSDAFSASLFKWDHVPRGAMPVPPLATPLPQPPPPPPPPPPQAAAAAATAPYSNVRSSSWQQPGLGGFENLFESYGIRYYTAEKIFEMGFTMNTLLQMKDEELDDMMNRLSRIFRWDLLVGERYGVIAAVRAERYRLEEEESRRLHHLHLLHVDTTNTQLDALSQEGLSDEAVLQQETEVLGCSGGGGITGGRRTWELARTMHRRKKKGRGKMESMEEVDESDGGGGGGDDDENVSGRSERQREHPFIVTEPGEVARGKKNGLDYLFHLFEQCSQFLIQVQTIAKERGEKSPTKVTNQVFRYAKKAGASYINKPKMRHYVHCYALHCLDEETSNALRRAFKERRENVGAWRQACYKPLVDIAAQQGWDIDAIFNAHPRLSIWYVPTKLRQLCHVERSNTAAASSSVAGGADYLPF